MLLAAVALKLLPVIVTVVPTVPDVGEKEEMSGGVTAHAFDMLNNKIRTNKFSFLNDTHFLTIKKSLEKVTLVCKRMMSDKGFICIGTVF
jgi:hypothetical protein